MPVESRPSPTVHDVPVEPLSTPIARTADPAFEERWAAWRARGLRHETAVRWRRPSAGWSSPSSWDLSHWDSVS